MARLETPRAPPGDRAREQLLDRPVDHRDDHEHHRPQQRDALVVDVVERVGGDGEVGERDDARRRDADRQDLRARAVARAADCLALRARHRFARGHALTSSMVHGNGERISSTAPCRDSSSTNARRDQWLRWPGVFPRSFTYAPRARFSPRHSGSRGTDTRRCPPRATRAISATVCSGSGTCSSTSIAAASSNSPSVNGSRSAFITRYSRFGADRTAHSACSAGSSRSMPTTRPSRSRVAHFCVSTPSPQPTSSTERGDAFAHSSSSVRSKPAISFLTTGFEDPYLSYVLPVTVPSASRVTVELTAERPQLSRFARHRRRLRLRLARSSQAHARPSSPPATSERRPARSATAGCPDAARSAAHARTRAGA